MLWRAILLMLALGPVPVAAGEATLWIEAQGFAHVTSTADRDAARLRAIGEALVSAALAGGASLRGHTVMDKGRITADLSILRPTGRVLSHRVLSAELVDGQWRVRIAAQVGPMSSGACAARRRLTISATPPLVRVSPKVAAWIESLAQSVAHDLVDTLRRHPDADLDSIAPAVSGPVAATLDYAALTRGRAKPAAGDHRLRPSIVVEAAGKGVRLTLTLALRGPDGERIERTFTRETAQHSGGVIGLISGPTRRRAEVDLTRGLMQEVRAMLDGLACEPAQARVVWRGDALSVSLGRRHGLTRASLAFVDDPNDRFGLLEVVELGQAHVTLRPLDPTRAAQSFDGLRVYFLEAGL
jgi:hypothetical protein